MLLRSNLHSETHDDDRIRHHPILPFFLSRHFLLFLFSFWDDLHRMLSTISRGVLKQQPQLQQLIKKQTSIQVATIMGSVFGKDLNDMENGIERMTRDITDRFRRAERVLQKVGTASRRAR